MVNQAARRMPAVAPTARAQVAVSAVSAVVAVALAFPFWMAFERPLRPRHKRPTTEPAVGDAAAAGPAAVPDPGGVAA